jgi:undecaprenyl pyrophosphate phosphatase UppP
VFNVLIGFLPAAVLGLLVYKVIKGYLFNAPWWRPRSSSAG